MVDIHIEVLGSYEIYHIKGPNGMRFDKIATANKPAIFYDG